MITPEEKAKISRFAVIPEQLPDYVQAITQAEAYLMQDCLVYIRGTHCSLVAYPLGSHSRPQPFDRIALEALLAELQKIYNPQVISVISPVPCDLQPGWEITGEDHYYRLELDQLKPDKKLRNLLKRAEAELAVSTQPAFDCRHKKLVNEFLKTHKVSSETRAIFKRLPRIAKNPGSVLISAFNHGGKLAAFDLFDFSATEVGFYLFNFYSRRHYIPGASDTLLAQGVRIAQEKGITALNLGLGIHAGIERFKRKWGARPFLDYFAYQREPETHSAVDALYAKF